MGYQSSKIQQAECCPGNYPIKEALETASAWSCQMGPKVLSRPATTAKVPRVYIFRNTAAHLIRQPEGSPLTDPGVGCRREAHWNLQLEVLEM